MSLPVGDWSWNERWVCPGDESLKPTDRHSTTISMPGSKVGTKTATDLNGTGAVSKPVRYQAPDDKPSSLYTEDFRGPEGWKPTTQLQQTRKYVRHNGIWKVCMMFLRCFLH